MRTEPLNVFLVFFSFVIVQKYLLTDEEEEANKRQQKGSSSTRRSLPLNNTSKAIDFLVFWGHQSNQFFCFSNNISLKFPQANIFIQQNKTKNTIHLKVRYFTINIILQVSSFYSGFFFLFLISYVC